MPQPVVRLNQDSVFSHIQSFIRNKSIKSKNTAIAYENDIRQFFSYMKGKEIENLTTEDLSIKNSHMLEYQTYLFKDYRKPSGERYSNATIKRKIDSVVALFRFLRKNDYEVNPDILTVDELPDDSKQIGFLTVDEIELMLSMSDDEVLKAFIVLNLHTSMRKDALLQLEWKQFVPKYDEPDFWIIETMDKGKKDFKEIHVSVYELLLKIKSDDKHVFSIPKSTLDYRFKSLCGKIGIDPLRKVSIHSIRKAGIDFVKQYTGDLQAAQQQGTHSSPAVTAAIYTQKPKNMAARILSQKLDEGLFDQLTHDELLRLVKSFGNGVGHQLKVTAKRIIENR